MGIKKKIICKKGPEAKGPYSPCIKTCENVYISGQLPLDPETGKMIAGDIKAQTRQCLENMKALLKEADMEMKYVVKTTVFLKDMDDFSAMNEVYQEYFEEPYPARSACSVSGLSGGALVEIEAVAIDFRALEILCAQEEECCDGSCCCRD